MHSEGDSVLPEVADPEEEREDIASKLVEHDDTPHLTTHKATVTWTQHRTHNS